MIHQIRFTEEARAALQRLYDFLLKQAQLDAEIAERALTAVGHAIALLETTPFSCRKADPRNPFLRELVIGFGTSGYVALFEIDDDQSVTILAVSTTAKMTITDQSARTPTQRIRHRLIAAVDGLIVERKPASQWHHDAILRRRPHP